MKLIDKCRRALRDWLFADDKPNPDELAGWIKVWKDAHIAGTQTRVMETRLRAALGPSAYAAFVSPLRRRRRELHRVGAARA